MSFAHRLSRLEASVVPEPEVGPVAEWTESLPWEDLLCLATVRLTGFRVRLPDGVTLEQAKARAEMLIQAAPDSVRQQLQQGD